MAKLDEILKKQKEASEQGKKVQQEIEEYRQAVLKGKESTGDAIKDFCIVHHLTDDEKQEGEFRKLSKSIAKAKGEPLLVMTKFAYVYNTTVCGYNRPEYERGEMTFLRATTADKPEWTINGVTVPGKHYAFATGGRFFMEPLWEAHTAPLVMTAAELFNNYYAWSRKEKENSSGRTDLPDEFWRAFGEGPGDYRSERENCETEILVGKDALTQFKHWGLRWVEENGKREYKRIDSYAEALHCIQNGMTVKESAEREQGERYRRQVRIAEGLVRAIEAGESPDDIKERLKLGAKADVQHLYLTQCGKRGVKYEFPDFFSGLCKEYGVKYK